MKTISKQPVYFICFTIIIFFSASKLPAQGIRGTITDESGNPVPGVSIYISQIQSGTTSNLEGNYEYKLDKGTYNISFQSLGFEKQGFETTITGDWVTRNIQLKTIQYNLHEVKIYSGEDPAYAIMRKAIARAPYHLRQANNYEAEVYLKGSLKINKIPKLIQKNLEVNGEKVKPGETYTSESLNIIKFSAPDSFVHTVKSSRSSFPGNEESGLMGYINSSFYDSSNEEMIISPLSPQALRHYKFRYDGFFEDGDVTVNKISVTPKRKSQQLVEGDLFIVEGLWSIHSLDMTHQAFWGKLRIRQIYQPVKPTLWLPVNHNFDVVASIMGVKADFHYAGSVKYLSVNLNNKLTQLVATARDSETKKENAESIVKKETTKSLKSQKKMDELLAREDLSNKEMMKLAAIIEKENKQTEKNPELELKNNYKFDIKKDSIKRDSLYWNNIRPIPLTTNEKISFSISDSIKSIKALPDSTKTNNKKSSSLIGNFLTGYSYPGDTAKIRVTYGGLIQPKNLGFNPVDGWKYAQNLLLNWKQDSVHSMKFSFLTGYAFAKEKAYGSFKLTQTYLPQKRGEISISGFIGSEDFKKELAIPDLLSMASSLFFKENYQRFYSTKNMQINNGIDLSNGFRMELEGGYYRYSQLQNNTNYSILKDKKEYKPNEILNPHSDENNFIRQDALIVKMNLEYTPGYYYYYQKGTKMMSHSDYPTFTLGLERGIKALSTNADFFLVEAGVFKKPEFSFRPVFDWSINGGWFIRNKQMHFSNYKHFQASAIPVIFTSPANSFVLLDDYLPSTNQWYVNGNITYSSPYLLLKNLPVLSKRLWNEDLHLSYLHTPLLRNYIQAGYSISRIFMVGSVGVFTGFIDGKYHHWGVRVAVKPF